MFSFVMHMENAMPGWESERLAISNTVLGDNGTSGTKTKGRLLYSQWTTWTTGTWHRIFCVWLCSCLLEECKIHRPRSNIHYNPKPFCCIPVTYHQPQWGRPRQFLQLSAQHQTLGFEAKATDFHPLFRCLPPQAASQLSLLYHALQPWKCPSPWPKLPGRPTMNHQKSGHLQPFLLNHR